MMLSFEATLPPCLFEAQATEERDLPIVDQGAAVHVRSLAARHLTP